MSDVLIIHNDYEDLLQLSSILRQVGLSVRVCRNGDTGLRAARLIAPDLVLMDVLLPDQDGFVMCRQLRALAGLSETPVIFISALQDASLKAQAFEIGADDFIAKPYNTKEVVVRVQHQLERVRLRAKIQEAARHQERQHIARELHDSVNQTLFILNASVQSLLLTQKELPDIAQQQLMHIQALSRAALAEMRTLLFELRPRQIENASLKQLIDQLVESCRMRTKADIAVVADENTLPNEVKLVFYRVAQEALNNISKHAQAQHVTVVYTVRNSVHQLVVKDDGHGFDSAQRTAGMGLQTMRERAEECRASLSLISTEGVGTQIELSWQAGSAGV
ncbi:MAG: response regulator [Chloroflexi bacterium]|nr:response regulator [Chloroflexota bacterium]